MSKNHLKIALGVLVGIGFGAALTVFASSLKPSDKANAEREAWNTPPLLAMTPGQVILRDVSKGYSRNNANGSWSPIYGERDILIRDLDGSYYSYRSTGAACQQRLITRLVIHVSEPDD